MINPVGNSTAYSIIGLQPLSNPTNTLNTIRNLNTNVAAQNTSLERLSTGSRINKAADDPAGLISSENIASMLAYLEAESQGLERVQSVVSTADGALGEVSELLRRAESLEAQNANTAGVSDEERAANDMEISQIRSSVNRMLDSSSFNGQSLFDGSLELNAAGGASLEIEAMRLGTLEGTSEERIETLHSFSSKIAMTRGSLGSFSRNVVDAQQSNITTATENLSLAKSLIKDTDFGAESANLKQSQILVQSSMQLLAFMNSGSASVIDVFG